MGEGAVTGFSWLKALTRLHGVDGIRYTKVTAPLKIETGKLIIAKGSSAEPPRNDPIYRGARLAEDGSVTFDKKLYFVADLNVNFQLLNALAGGAAGAAGALNKGGGKLDIGKQLGTILEGAVGGGREQGKDADFRDATVKVTGASAKPSFAVVKIGPPSKQEPSRDPKQNQQDNEAAADGPSAPKPGKILEDQLRKGIDSLFRKK
jgi:translocation and assembly module TamB